MSEKITSTTCNRKTITVKGDFYTVYLTDDYKSDRKKAQQFKWRICSKNNRLGLEGTSVSFERAIDSACNVLERVANPERFESMAKELKKHR